MPLVSAAGYPVLTEPTAPVRTDVPDAYQHIQATPGAFGSQVGQAVSALGQEGQVASEGLFRAASQRLDLWNKTSGQAATNSYIDSVNRLVEGDQSDPNAPPGLLALKGRAALDATPHVRQSVIDQFRQIRSGLANDYQRIEFDNEARRYQANALARIGFHYDAQSQAYAELTDQSTRALANQGMVTAINENNQDAFNAAVGRAMNSAIAEVNRKGGGPEAIEAALQKVRADAVKTEILTVGNKDPARAMSILNQKENQNLLTDTENATLHTHLREQADKATGFNLAFPGGAQPSIGGSAKTDWGTEHNNFGNIRKPGVTAPPSQGGFQSFATPEAGVQAIRDNLLAYQDQHGLNTIKGIVSRWAPPSENDTPSLVQRATQVLGVGPNQQIDLHDPAVMNKMVEATIRNEHGGAMPAAAIPAMSVTPNVGPLINPPGLQPELERVLASDATPKAKEEAIRLITATHSALWADAQHQKILQDRKEEAVAQQYSSDIESNKYSYSDIQARLARDSDPSQPGGAKITRLMVENLDRMAYEHATRGGKSVGLGPSFNDVWDAIRSGRITETNQITALGGSAGGLTPSGVEQALKLKKLQDDGSPDGELLAMMKATVTQDLAAVDQETGIPKPGGKQAVLDFWRYAFPEIERLRSGDKPMSMHDVSDLHNGPLSEVYKKMVVDAEDAWMKGAQQTQSGALPQRPAPGTVIQHDLNTGKMIIVPAGKPGLPKQPVPSAPGVPTR